MSSQSSPSFRRPFNRDNVYLRPPTRRDQPPTAPQTHNFRTAKAKKRANKKKREQEFDGDIESAGQAAQTQGSSSSQGPAAEGSAASKLVPKGKATTNDGQAEQVLSSNSSSHRGTTSSKDTVSKDEGTSADVPLEQGGKEEGRNENSDVDKAYRKAAGTHEAQELIPLTEFKYFRKMPLELRRMVWNLVLPDPQVITITGNGYFRRVIRGVYTTQSWIYRPSASYKIPSMLSVCKESREEVMVHHRPSFKAQFGGIPIFFNAKTDILYFTSTDALIHFYAGSIPNYVEHAFTRGYRWNMKDANDLVQQVAVGKVTVMEGVLGGIFNQMRGLKSVLLEDMNMGMDSGDLIWDFTMGRRELELGWEEYTLKRSPDKPVNLKILNGADFKTFIADWKGNIMQPEDFRDEEDEELEGCYDPYADPNSNADASTP